MLSRLFVFLFALTLTAAAQTYTPKTIRFEGAQNQDASQLLSLTGWKIGGPITKQEIEAGLQKLADTGSFTDINWHADNAALVITLTAAAGSVDLPVRFTNFVWWTPQDLERQVEARVPLYHGELTETGTLTTQVEAALTAIAQEKGIAITVAAIGPRDPTAQHGTLALSIDHPSIVFGDLQIADAKPAFGPTVADFKKGLRNQDFDVAMTAGTIRADGTDIFHNAGYLDVTIDPPVFSPPHAISNGYTVDATATVHPGELYRVTALNLPNPAPPFSEADLRKLADLKVGDPASPMGLDISTKQASFAYQGRGYLDADAISSTTIDNVTHGVSYAINITRGDLYHLASVDLSAAPKLQQSLARDPHLAPGAVADAHVMQTIRQALTEENLLRSFRVNSRRNRAAHTLDIVLVPAESHSPGS
jgi:outer membrane protein assembly factor BamA